MKGNLTRIIFAVLLISAVFTQTKVQPWSQVFAQVSESNEFGKSMGALIQMHISSKDVNTRVQEINDLVKGIQAQMIETNESEAARIANVRQQAEQEINSLTSQLTEANGQLLANQSEQSSLQEEQSQKKIALQQENDNYNSLQEDLSQSQADLEAENKSFSTKQADFNALIAACQAGIDLLTHMIHGEVEFGNRQGANFLQLVQVKNDFAGILDNFKQHSSVAMLEPVLNALVSLSSKTSINYEQFLQCIELLHDILARLKGDLTLLTNRHNQIVEDLTNMITDLNEWIIISGNIIQIHTDRLNEIATRLVELEGLINDVTAFISLLNKSLTEVTNELNQQNEAYEAAQIVRLGELKVMERLVEYFDQEVATNVGNVRNDAISL